MPTEADIATAQDGSSWLQTLLTGAVDAYSAVASADTARIQARANANKVLGSIPSAAQPAPASLVPGISNTVLILGSAAALVALVLVMRK